MEEVLAIIGFSLGASLGVGATRSLGEGARPAVRNVLKLGIRVWDAAASASSAAREQTGETPSPAVSTGGRRRASQPQKIAIARS
jgi:hypothetical protein